MKKTILTFLFFLASLSFVQAQKAQTFDLLKKNNSIKKLEANNDGFSLDVTTSKFTLKPVNTSKGLFMNLSGPKLLKVFTKGMPNLPVYSKLIEVPLDADVNIEIVSYDEETIDLNNQGISAKIIPAQASERKTPLHDVFSINEDIYHKNAFYSQGDMVSYEYRGQMRATRIGRIEIRPFSYNPIKNLLKIYTNIKVKVSYSGANHEATKKLKKKYGDGFGSVFSGFLHKLDYGQKGFLSQAPFTYVIVADRSYQSALQDFVKWKTKKGFKVIEAYTDDSNVGSTVSSIKAYCKNLYDNPPAGYNPLSFILVVGDINVIPATQHGEVSSSPYTDLDLAEYTGDYLPEVNFGRWAVDNATEVSDIVAKTIRYEKLQMADISYLHEAMLIAGDDESHEDTYGGGAIYYADHYYVNADHNTYSHTFLQNTIETWPGANTQAHDSIIKNINDGVGLANYTAHCSPDGWSSPSFSKNDLNNFITNVDKFGLWIGNCCQSNKFDENDAFAELAIKKPNAGVIGYIGGSQYTYWDEDYYWGVGVGDIVEQPTYEDTTEGVFDGVYHDKANETNDLSTWYITNYQLIEAGNLAVEASTSSMKAYYWVIYQLAGDPSIVSYMGTPQPMAVTTSPGTIILGNTSLTVTAVPYATVALSQNDVLIAAATTDASGSCTLHFASSDLSVGNADLVVTAQNKVPYISTIPVVPANNPYVSFKAYTTSATPDYGQTIDLNVNLENVATAGSGYDAYNVNATLSTSDTYITINTNTHAYGTIAAGAENMQNNAFNISIANNVPDQHIAHFDLIVTGTDSGGTSYTWNSGFNIILNAPKINISEVSITNDANANGYIDPGETGDIHYTITNTGHATAVYDGTLTISSDPNNYMTLGTSSISGINLAAGAAQDFAFTGASVVASAPLGSPIELTLDVTAGNSHQYTAQSIQTITTGIIPIFPISDGGTIVTCTGTFYDSGLDTGNYGSNEDYTMTFKPGSGSEFIVVDFTSFDIEDGYDYLYVYNGPDTSSPEISGSPFTGSNSPGTLYGANGLTFRFTSDRSIQHAGWVANVSCFTPTTVPDCAANPVPADGATDVYSSTSNLSWDSQVGITSYDVYFGTDSDPLNNSPVTVTTNSFPVSLSTNTTYYWTVISKNSIGNSSNCNVWSFTTGGALYNMTDGATITTCDGAFFDAGGPDNNYSNNLDQTMTFKPATSGKALSFNFTSFDVELGTTGTQYDYLEVYDGTDTSATLIGKFSADDGAPVPPELQPVTATNADGALTFVFHSDSSAPRSGWAATITCNPLAIDEYDNAVGIYPNPNTGSFTIKLKDMNKAVVKVYSTTGELVYTKNMNSDMTNINLSKYARGVYFVSVVSEDKSYVKKLIIK